MIELTALGIAWLIGLPVSAVFFWGLALGMRKALASENAAMWLLLSFVLRSLWVVLWALVLVRWLHPLSALLGLMLAFFMLRLFSVYWIKKKQVDLCN